jgi:hypothetical protein
VSVTVKFSNKRLVQKLRRIDARTTEGAKVVLKTALGDAMTRIITRQDRDTNRLVRGYAMAANAAGLGPFPVPDVVRSKRYEEALARLEQQLAWWQSNVEWFERKGLTNHKGYRRAVRVRDRAKEELEKLTGTSVVIGLYSSAGGKGKSGRRLRTTVRAKVYGGTGELRLVAGRPYYRIHNREPHATIVEKRNRLVATSLAELRAYGVRRQRRNFLRTVAAGTGAAKRA